MNLTKRIEQLQGKEALLKTWQEQPQDFQDKEKEYIKALKARLVQTRLYVKNHSLIKDV